MLPATRYKSTRRGGGGFLRQKMNKTGNTTAAANPVTGWTSDATYPATITSNKLQIVGSGTITITASANVATTWQAASTVTLYRNGVAIGSQTWATLTSATTKTITVPGVSVAAGDLIHIGITGSGMTLAATNTYIEVVPA